MNYYTISEIIRETAGLQKKEPLFAVVEWLPNPHILGVWYSRVDAEKVARELMKQSD